MAATAPPANLLRGQVGSEKWHKENSTTVENAKELKRDCGKKALDLWRPPLVPGQPEETPYESKLRKESWKFKLDVSSSGEVKRTPPEGPGVTLWKSKLKPPPWVCKMALPSFRDYFNTKNNEYMGQYARETRQVVSRMRQALMEINEQYKALVRARERLDATLAKIRQSLLTNKQTQAIRENRPTLEKVRQLLCMTTEPAQPSLASQALSYICNKHAHVCLLNPWAKNKTHKPVVMYD